MFEMKQQILDLLNSSGLPLDAILFIVKDIYRDAQEAYDEYIKNAEAPVDVDSTATQDEQTDAAAQ